MKGIKMAEVELSKELVAKARWVADLMIADGIKPGMLPEDMQEEAVFAYMDAITKKIAKIQAEYFTNREAREVFIKASYAQLSAS